MSQSGGEEVLQEGHKEGKRPTNVQTILCSVKRQKNSQLRGNQTTLSSCRPAEKNREDTRMQANVSQ